MRVTFQSHRCGRATITSCVLRNRHARRLDSVASPLGATHVHYAQGNLGGKSAATALHDVASNVRTPTAVEAIGVTKRYGDREALRGVDLVVPPGQLHGLLGP